MNLANCTPEMLKDYESKLMNGYIQNGEMGFTPDEFYKNDFGEHVWHSFLILRIKSLLPFGILLPILKPT